MELNTEMQNALYHSRDRTRSFRRPDEALKRSVQFDGASGTIVASELLSAARRSAPVTWSVGIAATGPSPTGVILEVGNSVNGLKMGLNAGVLFIAAGNATPSNLGGADGSIDISDALAVDQPWLLTLAVCPGTGRVRFWLGGTLILRMENAPNNAFTDTLWAEIGDGSFMAAANGASNERSSLNVNTAPSDFVLTERLNLYLGQKPKHFNNSTGSL